MSAVRDSVRKADDADAGVDERELFAAFVGDDASRQTVMQVMERRGWSSGDVESGGLAAAVRTLGIVPPARVMLVDLAGDEATPDALDALAELSRHGTAVIALGSVNDVHVFRRMLRAGAADYLVKPIDAEAVELALDRALQEQKSGSTPVRQGRCIAFIGARGGVGASTVAAAFAWTVAERLHRRAALVDLDLQFGIQGLLFDQEPNRGLREALDDPERVDSQFLERAMMRPGSRLHVLATEEAVDQAAEIPGDAVVHLLKQSRLAYDVTVLDLPRRAVTAQPVALGEITDVVIVGDRSLPALRDINRLTRFLRSTASESQVHLVLNRTETSRHDQVARRAFDGALELPVFAELPLDATAAARSLNGGQPLSAVAPRSRLVSELTTFATRLLGIQPRRRGLFRWKRR